MAGTRQRRESGGWAAGVAMCLAPGAEVKGQWLAGAEATGHLRLVEGQMSRQDVARCSGGRVARLRTQLPSKQRKKIPSKLIKPMLDGGQGQGEE